MLLFAAGTDAEWYEDELRKAGLPTYRATGKGYFGQQQVVDLLAYLRLLHNRYDDVALLTVLASPFVGLSNDALALVAPRRVEAAALRRHRALRCRPALDERDTRLLRAFRQRFDRLADAMPRLSLERLCERIVSEHDYDLAVLAQWDGRRRYANMRKLARLARSYEELRGPDVEGFVRFVAEQEAVGARELEAVAEEEGADAVRLLTIHAAKGLEFKVVIVADAGRDKAPPSPDEILALSDGRFGFRVADPVTTKRRGAFDYDDVREARRVEEEAEKLRLYYVAMTRAKERLIVSGSIDREKKADASTPIGWVLEPPRRRRGARGRRRRARRDRAQRRAARRAHRPLPTRATGSAHAADRGRRLAEAGQLALFAARRGGGRCAGRTGAAAARRAGRAAAASPAPALVHRALDVRAVLVQVLRALRRAGCASAGPSTARDGRRRPARDGDRRRGPPAARAGRPRTRRRCPTSSRCATGIPTVSDEELERIRGFVASYCDSELARRIAALDRVEKERHFTFEHDGVLLHGFLDVAASRRARARSSSTTRRT